MSTVRTQAGDGRKVGVLTRDDIKSALKEYARRYGDDFPQSAFSPALAKRNGRPELVERYYAGREDGRRWPSLNAIRSHYPSWNKARADIDLPANSTGPARGRRKPGEAEPILNVRERLIYVPDEKNRELRQQINRLQERVAALLEQRSRLREQLDQRRPIKGPAKTITKTETVRVVDPKLGRALQKAQAKLADETARGNALAEQLQAERKDRLSMSRELAKAQADLAAAQADAKVASAERDSTADRLVALDVELSQLRDELEQARQQSMGAAEAAAASDLVRRAELRAKQAEVRAARAERIAAEHGAAVTGELRPLTAGELAELQRKGPAGRSTLEKALRKLMHALGQGGNDPKRQALTDLASAAVMWRDQL